MITESSIRNEDLHYLAVSLWVSSHEMTPDEITEAIGIEPTYRRERGAPIRGRLMRRPEFDLHEWRLREQIAIRPGDDLSKRSEEFISQFLSKIKEAAPKVRELSKDHDVLIQIVYRVRSMPYVGLTSGQVQDIASLGASLDYDLMVDDCDPVS